MSTILLTWNPKRTPWPRLREFIHEIAEYGTAPDDWSCGNTRRIQPGDRLFLLRQGQDDPGLVGSGWATSEPYEADHWKDDFEESAPTAWYVNLEWDVLSEETLLPARPAAPLTFRGRQLEYASFRHIHS